LRREPRRSAATACASWARLALGCATLCLAAGPAAALGVRRSFTATTPVTGLAQPTAAAFAPDGRLVILEKNGFVRQWTAAGGLRPDPLLTLPVCTDSEMGLLGLAFDPEFVSNHYLYLYQTHPPGDDPARCGEGVGGGRVNRVVRVTLGDQTIDPSSLVVIVDGLRTDGGNHDGGCVRVGPDGNLYVATGDTGISDGGPPGASSNPYAQDLQHREGKILRVTRAGDPAPGNPFAAMGGNAAFVYAYGFRNPFRFAFDPITPGPQLLWAADVGQVTWEEIDVVTAGGNYGWPQCEGNEPMPACPGNSTPPVYAYRHPGNPNEIVSVTGGVHYDGAQFEDAYRGSYFFGDFGLNRVYRAEVNATRDGIVGDPQVFSADPEQPVDFFVGPDGALYWVAFGSGSIVRVTQDGRPGAAIGGCERTIVSAASTLLLRAGKRVAACFAKARTACAFPAPPGVPHRLRRRIGAACGAADRARVCLRLGCASCASPRDLVACVAALTAGTAGSIATPIAGAAPGKCRTATARSMGFAGRDRMGAITDCAETGADTCVPPPTPPAPMTKGLSRACAIPPQDVCASLQCGTCASPADLATCVAAQVAGGVDGFAAAVMGAVR